MWETFLATFLGTILGALLAGVSFLATWKFMANWGTRAGRSTRFQFRLLSLSIRFMWLVLRRRRKFSERRSWHGSEIHRIHLFNLVSQAPKARIELFRSAMQPLGRFSAAHSKMLLGSPLGILTEALGRMSTEELGTPSEPHFDDTPQPERAERLVSQPYIELAKWALRLDHDDRAAWMLWLKSQESQTEIENALKRALEHD